MDIFSFVHIKTWSLNSSLYFCNSCMLFSMCLCFRFSTVFLVTECIRTPTWSSTSRTRVSLTPTSNRHGSASPKLLDVSSCCHFTSSRMKTCPPNLVQRKQFCHLTYGLDEFLSLWSHSRYLNKNIQMRVVLTCAILTLLTNWFYYLRF